MTRSPLTACSSAPSGSSRCSTARTHAGPPDRRLRQVRREIETTGTYRHTPAELEFGARVAWRNSSRCIGRLYWRSLRVRDRREVTAAPDIAAESIAHLREATNGGRIRPMITVFAPDAPDRPGPRILNSQLVRYAGYETADGAVIGDPANADLTRLARDLGWPGGGPAGRFDMLPLVVQEAGAPAHAARAARRRGTRGQHRASGVRLVRRPRAALVRRAGDQRHVPGRSAASATRPRHSTAGTCAPRSGRATSATPAVTTSCR